MYVLMEKYVPTESITGSENIDSQIINLALYLSSNIQMNLRGPIQHDP